MNYYAGYLTPECETCRFWKDEGAFDTGCSYFSDCAYRKLTAAKVKMSFSHGILKKKTKAQSLHLYSYDGPVMRFENCLDDYWKARTLAVSEKKARTNLTYQYKKEYHYAVDSKITLPGKITLIK